MGSQQLQKCTIINLDEPSVKIPAQYNPNKVKIGAGADWKKVKSKGGSADMLEFSSAKNRTLSLELFFDGLENRDYTTDNTKVNVETTYVEPLLELTSPDKKRESGKGGEKAKRPPFVMVAWGQMRPFRGIIESVDYEFSMFLANGTPVRATVNLKITELDMIQMTGSHKSEYKNALANSGGS